MIVLQCYICERGGKQTRNNEVTHVSINISLFLYINLSIGKHKKKIIGKVSFLHQKSKSAKGHFFYFLIFGAENLASHRLPGNL